MGKFKERLITLITADLVNWRRTGSSEFLGTVFNSIDTASNVFVDNNLVRVTFIDVLYYPALTGHWEDHYIGRTLEGKYIRMQTKHEFKVPG